MGIGAWTAHSYQLAKALKLVKQGEAFVKQEWSTFLGYTSKETISNDNQRETLKPQNDPTCIFVTRCPNGQVGGTNDKMECQGYESQWGQSYIKVQRGVKLMT